MAVEDTSTTGGSVLTAVEALIEAGAILGGEVGYLLGHKYGRGLFDRPDGRVFNHQRVVATEPDAATPAINNNESPGNARPIKSPVSAKTIIKTPAKPRLETIECASKRFIRGRLSHA